MAYASWSVVFGEQPSAAKWNILGTNDVYFNTQVGSNFGSGTTSTVWWEELGRTTLGSDGDTVTVSGLASRKYLQIHFGNITSGSTNVLLRFNADSGANYAYRSSTDGGADTTAVSQSEGQLSASGSTNSYGVVDVLNVSSIEKYAIGNFMRSTSSAASAPSRLEGHIKWANTSSVISSVTIFNNSTGNFATGSQAVVLGHD